MDNLKIILIIILVILSIFFILFILHKPAITILSNITLNKYQDGRLHPADHFQPLEKGVISFPKGRGIQGGILRITDSQKILYLQKDLSLKEIAVGEVMFYSGKALGKQQLSLNLKKDNGKEIHYEKEFILEAETRVETGNPVWDQYYPKMKEFILRNRRTMEVNGRKVIGYRSPDTTPIFLRDHTYQMEGFKYFESEMKSTLDFFLEVQRPNGEYLEMIWENPETKKIELLRNEAEADPEYLAVMAAYQIWQATGDDDWLKSQLPKLEKGLNYSMTDPYRWSKEYQLVKRPYTLDTWDFEYRNTGWPYDTTKSKMGIMHGDNSGMYAACRELAGIYQTFGNISQSQYWNQKAEDFKTRMNKVCWNGKFYTHRIPIDKMDVPQVNVQEMLSLSNPYDINRGVADHSQAVKILQEYQDRKKKLNPPPFAEWFSIQPFFPTGSFRTTADSWTKTPGEYVNGGIMPIVGGELANAGFQHGYETYAISILKQYTEMVYTQNTAYLWYYWDGRPGVSHQEYFSSDGWGAAAMLSAFLEGLAGIKDNSKLMGNVSCSPRWTYADVTAAYVVLKYGASDSYCAYQYNYDKLKKEVGIQFTGSGRDIHFEILLPATSNVNKVLLNEQPVPYTIQEIENSRYLVLDSQMDNKFLRIELKD